MLQKLRYPPLKSWVPKFYKFLLLTDISYKRPISVEHEEAADKRAKLYKKLGLVVALISMIAGIRAGYGAIEVGLVREVYARILEAVRERLSLLYH